MFSMAMWMAVIVAPLQVLAGDQHGLNTLEHQPAKVAALEGDWESRQGQPLILFGMPNMEKERTDWAIEIPHLGALVLTHTWNGAIKGLKDFPPQDRPYAPVVFWAFRIMVGLGLLMAAVGIWGAWLRIRNRLYTSTWLRRAMLLLAPSGFIALLAGWTVTRWAASHSPFMDCCAPPTVLRRSMLRALPRPWGPLSLYTQLCLVPGSSFCFACCAGRRQSASRVLGAGCPSARPGSRRRRR